MFESLKLLDRDLFLCLNGYHSSLTDELMFYISQVWVFIPLFAYWLYLVFKKYGWKKTLLMTAFLGLLIALTDQSSNQVKHGVKRYRPSHNLEIMEQVHILHDYRGGQYGFFSGHSANCFGIAMLLFLVFSKRSIWFRSSFFLWAAVTAYSRIYLGVHYPSDIFIGFLVGLFWGYAVYRLMNYLFKKYFHEPVAI
jgi:undecaprenyl-diphosphatase